MTCMRLNFIFINSGSQPAILQIVADVKSDQLLKTKQNTHKKKHTRKHVGKSWDKIEVILHKAPVSTNPSN